MIDERITEDEINVLENEFKGIINNYFFKKHSYRNEVWLNINRE